MTTCLPLAELLSCGPALHALHGLHDPHCQRSQFTWEIGKQHLCPPPGEYNTAPKVPSPGVFSKEPVKRSPQGSHQTPVLGGEETEAQRSQMTCPVSSRCHWVLPRSEEECRGSRGQCGLLSSFGSILSAAFCSRLPFFPAFALSSKLKPG